MAYEKTLLSMPSPLRSPASWRAFSATVEHIRMIVNDRHAPFFTRNDSGYHVISALQGSVSGRGELIIGLRNSVSDRCELRNYALSTGVDKAVSNSNLNYDF
jgi:hypothetical protein